MTNINEMDLKDSIPEIPALITFANFSEAVTCREKLNQHSSKWLELRSKLNTAENKTEYIKEIIVPYIGSNKEISFEIGPLDNINLEFPIKKILTAEDDFENLVIEAQYFIDSISSSFCSSEDFPFFKLLLELEKLIKDMDFIKNYEEWKYLDESLKSSCSVLKDIVLTDDILWDDLGKTRFKLPINLNNGSVRISKFIDENHPQQIKKALEMEIRFKNFKNAKLEATKIGVELAKNNNIIDENNPFLYIVKILENSKLNTLT